MAQRKTKTSGRKRSSRKILDAYQIAERAENRSGSDNSGDESDIQDGIMDARRFLKDGKGADDKFEDEELDSDEALGSDDDYDVLNSKFSQTIRDNAKKQKERARKKARGELDSDDEEQGEDGYDSIDESQLVNLSEAWDMDEADLRKASKGGDIVLDDNWESASEEESEDEDDEDEEEDDEDEEEGESDADIFENGSDDEIDLKNTVSHLQAQLKKPQNERRRLVKESTSENEFHVPAGTQGLSLQEMISAVDSSVSKDAILIDSQISDKSKALATPLPKRIQERHDRKVAYEISKKEVSKWQNTVNANRDADVLKFPMGPTSRGNKKSANVVLPSDPSAGTTSELENKINALLEESSLVDDKKEATFEQIAVAKLSPAEMIKRTNELRLMRELMFRDEAKAKRIKKIKSKLYHKIKKKERLRNAELVEGEDEEDLEDIEDHDLKRAQERMTLRHKTQSLWAKSMIKSGLSKDASNRAELEEMLRQGERLRSKQLGYEDGDQSDDNISDIEREYTKEESADIDRSKLGKGVLAMDFMKNAEQRRKQENLKEIEDLKKFEATGGAEEFEGDSSSVNTHLNQGRRVYAPSSVAVKEAMEEADRETLQEIEDDQSKSLINKLKGKFSDDRLREKLPEQTPVEVTKNVDEEEEDAVNPWMMVSKEPVRKSNKITAVDQTSSKLAKSAAKIAKSKKRSSSQRDDDVDTVIDVQKTLTVINKDDEEEHGDEVRMFSQSELIKQAFAGDDVVKEFEDEKKQVIADEDDKEEDVTLPGWGDWAGGADFEKNKKRKKFVRTIDGVAQKDRRKDKKLKDVIINEKVNKKNLKYQSSDVPYPFESREQYERSLRMPIGQEWTSRDTHQKLTMPRIITKQGTVIDPLKAPFK